MTSRPKTAPAGAPLPCAASVAAAADAPAVGSISYQAARIAAEASCDVRTVLTALREQDYSSNKARARISTAIEALAWDREQLERDAVALHLQKG